MRTGCKPNAELSLCRKAAQPAGRKPSPVAIPWPQVGVWLRDWLEPVARVAQNPVLTGPLKSQGFRAPRFWPGQSGTRPLRLVALRALIVSDSDRRIR